MKNKDLSVLLVFICFLFIPFSLLEAEKKIEITSESFDNSLSEIEKTQAGLTCNDIECKRRRVAENREVLKCIETVSSKRCQAIAEEDRRVCGEKKKGSAIYRCVVDIGKDIWGIIKLINHVFTSNVFAEDEFAGMFLNYLSTEVEKTSREYADFSGLPARLMKIPAFPSVLSKAVFNTLSDSVQNFNCYNQKVQLSMICRFLSELTLGAGGGTLAYKGSQRALKKAVVKKKLGKLIRDIRDQKPKMIRKMQRKIHKAINKEFTENWEFVIEDIKSGNFQNVERWSETSSKRIEKEVGFSKEHVQKGYFDEGYIQETFSRRISNILNNNRSYMNKFIEKSMKDFQRQELSKNFRNLVRADNKKQAFADWRQKTIDDFMEQSRFNKMALLSRRRVRQRAEEIFDENIDKAIVEIPFRQKVEEVFDENIDKAIVKVPWKNLTDYMEFKKTVGILPGEKISVQQIKDSLETIAIHGEGMGGINPGWRFRNILKTVDAKSKPDPEVQARVKQAVDEYMNSFQQEVTEQMEAFISKNGELTRDPIQFLEIARGNFDYKKFTKKRLKPLVKNRVEQEFKNFATQNAKDFKDYFIMRKNFNIEASQDFSEFYSISLFKKSDIIPNFKQEMEDLVKRLNHNADPSEISDFWTKVEGKLKKLREDKKDKVEQVLQEIIDSGYNINHLEIIKIKDDANRYFDVTWRYYLKEHINHISRK